ncbi:MAG: UvrB/UvrC motif-containing protein, partial [Chloroflexi bacterium]|nr:UvrB/UvrC motif-containing protein [Chloroflexota bacterium]
IVRAARHVNSHAILYADRITDSMRRAIDETHRRRATQDEYNRQHEITPVGITKEIRDIASDVANQVRDEFDQRMVAEDSPGYDAALGANIPEDMTPDQIARMISELESRMKQAARDLEFEKAAALRDQIVELRRDQAALGEDLQQWSDQAYGRRRRPLKRREPVSRQR